MIIYNISNIIFSRIKFVALSLLIMLSLFFAQYATANTDIFADDSCTDGVNITERIKSDLTTLGLFTAYSANFYMAGADGSGDYNSNPSSECNRDFYPDDFSSGDNAGSLHDDDTCNSKGGMKMCYKYIDGGVHKWDCNWVNADGWGPKHYDFPAATLRAMTNNNKICAYFNTPLGYQIIGCKDLPDCTVYGKNESCFVAESCGSSAFRESRSLLPFSGSVIQCVKESIARLFVDTTACGDDNYMVSYFPSFQNSMRKAVRAALVLYLIIFGIKMALGNDMPSKSEFFNMGAKYILVLYFSVGVSMEYGVDNQPIYDDGITTYMLPFFTNATTSLSNMVYSAGGSRGLCAYDPDDYKNGYSYLSMWDSLDCRLIYYYGADMQAVAAFIDSGITASGSYSSVMGTAELGSAMLLYMILPALFSFQIIFLVFLTVFAIFLLSSVIYFVNVMIKSLVMVGVLVYLAPIFVPFALFHPTKGYYNGWLRLLISFSLQPVIVAAYIALMMTVFDQTIFGDCSFSKVNVSFSYGGSARDLPFYMLCDPDSPASGCVPVIEGISNLTPCKETIGYFINPIKAGYSYTDTISQYFFSVTQLGASVVGDMLTSLITLCLFAYLFIKLGDILSTLAGDLTGGVSLAKGSSLDTAIELLKAAVKAKMGDKKGAAQSLAKAASGGSK